MENRDPEQLPEQPTGNSEAFGGSEAERPWEELDPRRTRVEALHAMLRACGVYHPFLHEEAHRQWVQLIREHQNEPTFYWRLEEFLQFFREWLTRQATLTRPDEQLLPPQGHERFESWATDQPDSFFSYFVLPAVWFNFVRTRVLAQGVSRLLDRTPLRDRYFDPHTLDMDALYREFLSRIGRPPSSQ